MDSLKPVSNARFSIRWTLELLWALAIQRISSRYKETFFGFGWIFLQPVALTIIFTYIFQRFSQVPSAGVPYPIFAATGLIMWSLTSLVVSQSTSCISGHSAMLRRIALPRIVLPMSVVVSALVDMLVMGILLAGLFIYYRHPLSSSSGWFFLVFSIHLLLLTSLACIMSLMNVLFKDIGHALVSLLQIWFFASPVFYPYSMVPQEFRLVALWNPMTGILESYRAVLLLGQAPPFDLLRTAFIVSGVLFLFGIFFFFWLEKVVADYV